MRVSSSRLGLFGNRPLSVWFLHAEIIVVTAIGCEALKEVVAIACSAVLLASRPLSQTPGVYSELARGRAELQPAFVLRAALRTFCFLRLSAWQYRTCFDELQIATQQTDESSLATQQGTAPQALVRTVVIWPCPRCYTAALYCVSG
jgi:hypothetical protein